MSHGAEAAVESRHVHAVYSQIASHFSDTRYKPWPKVAEFLLNLPPGSLIADIGCGNGKYLSVAGSGYTIGCDMCCQLVNIAGSRGHEVAVGDILNLPFRTNSFDAVISIAVVHHLSSHTRRLQALCELLRVVREGGVVLVYVWAMEQERKKFTEQDVLVPWHLQPRYVSTATGSEAVLKKKKMNKKQKTRRRKELHEQGDTKEEGEKREGEEREGEKEEGEERGVEPAANLQPDSDDKEDHVMPGLGHVTTKGDHMTPSLEAQGFQTLLRYYHVFQRHELSALFNEVGGVKVLEEFYDHENWCVVAEKIKTTS